MAIARDHADFWYIDRGLRTACFRFGWTYFAHCVMPNHYHLIVDAELRRLSAGMQWLNWRIARRFNSKYGRVGHFVEKRFDAWVIDDDEHFENACVYVWMNAVRAGIAETPEEWPWCGLARSIHPEEQARSAEAGRGRTSLLAPARSRPERLPAAAPHPLDARAARLQPTPRDAVRVIRPNGPHPHVAPREQLGLLHVTSAVRPEVLMNRARRVAAGYLAAGRRGRARPPPRRPTARRPQVPTRSRWTGERAGAHEHSGEASPPRPLSAR